MAGWMRDRLGRRRKTYGPKVVVEMLTASRA